MVWTKDALAAIRRVRREIVIIRVREHVRIHVALRIRDRLRRSHPGPEPARYSVSLRRERTRRRRRDDGQRLGERARVRRRAVPLARRCRLRSLSV